MRHSFKMMRLLQANGLSRKQFDELLGEQQSWRDIESIVEILQDGGVRIIQEDDKETSADFLVYESGGCSSYLKIRRRLVSGGSWKWMFLPEECKMTREFLRTNVRP
jgi:hypothetical protein